MKSKICFVFTCIFHTCVCYVLEEYTGWFSRSYNHSWSSTDFFFRWCFFAKYTGLSWLFRQLRDRFWWMCSLSFMRCVMIWQVVDVLHYLLLMMSLDCPLTIRHKKGEYIWMGIGGDFVYFGALDRTRCFMMYLCFSLMLYFFIFIRCIC